MARAVGGAHGTRPRVRLPAALGALVVGGALALAGCSGQEQSGPPAARVATWVSGAGGGAAIATLRVDAANVSQALARHDPPAAIKTVCALLTTDAETAIGNLPTPDATLTDELNTAYEDAASAGDDCYSGAGGDHTLLARSAHERDALESKLVTAVNRITIVTGHPPSTSTTLPADGGDPFGG
ncbi:MAG TPA: hypothetical protein VG032_05745 [Acidimicrobiales bacterium]|nr:hypothetical protein [Acidimicrobiales bacterium]